MIGGLDTVFPVLSGATALDFCVRLVSQGWPDCVFVVDNDPTIYQHHGQLSFQATSEIIIYRDQIACDAWDEIGYDDSLRGTMVYLISESKQLTVITEHDPSPQIQLMIDAITEGLPTAFPFWHEFIPKNPLEAA